MVRGRGWLNEVITKLVHTQEQLAIKSTIGILLIYSLRFKDVGYFPWSPPSRVLSKFRFQTTMHRQ